MLPVDFRLFFLFTCEAQRGSFMNSDSLFKWTLSFHIPAHWPIQGTIPTLFHELPVRYVGTSIPTLVAIITEVCPIPEQSAGFHVITTLQQPPDCKAPLKLQLSFSLMELMEDQL